MNISSIPVISVSYNSVDLIAELLSSFREHYSNHVIIIDGSDDQHYSSIEKKCAEYPNVRFIHFDFNIHHGPGMAWAFQNLNLQGPVLVLDSDISIMKHGFLEDMAGNLNSNMYGVGYVNQVDEGGFDVLTPQEGTVCYLHPACMLVNIDVVLNWPMPTKHGAPMFEPMIAIHRAGRSDLIMGLDWVRDDFGAAADSDFRHYLRHDWQGTVKKSGSYNLDEWSKFSRETAIVRQSILNLIPPGSGSLVELGESDGLLRRACKQAYPERTYIALGNHPDKAINLSSSVAFNIDHLDEGFFRSHAETDCWILYEALEKSNHPEKFLARLRKCINPNACVLAIIPNAQHWSMQMRLISGDLTYAEKGLLSPGQRRWFSRDSVLKLFREAGFSVSHGLPVTYNPLNNLQIENAMRQLYLVIGTNPVQAFEDSQTDIYIIKAKPI